MTPPDVRSLLPSATRRAVEAWYVERIAATLDYRAMPTYTILDALVDAERMGDYASSIAISCWDAARLTFDREHPLRWDNDLQRAYREGLSSAGRR